MDYTFAHPDFFWGLLLIPLLLAWHIISRKRQQAHLLTSSINAFPKSGSLSKLRPILFLLRLLAIALIVTARDCIPAFPPIDATIGIKKAKTTICSMVAPNKLIQ